MNTTLVKDISSSTVIERHPQNPILSAKDIPYEAGLVFNAGITKYQGRYVMVFRNDYGCNKQDFEDFAAGKRDYPRLKTNIGLAYSKDGVNWEVQPKPCFSLNDEEYSRAYDPRLTVIDGRVYMCFAVDSKHGILGGIAVTDDFQKWEILHMTVPDNRNMVMFPEKIGGMYYRLERPFPVYSQYGAGDKFDIWISNSPDVRYWGNSKLLLGVEHVPYANDKIGPAAPPVKTKKGWLTTIHTVDRDPSRGRNGWEAKWPKRYCAGLILLDLNDPTKVVAMSKKPLLVPEAPYETEDGFRTNVIFPGGMILEDSGEVKIYYGASDTFTCLATAHVDDLLKLCDSPR